MWRELPKPSCNHRLFVGGRWRELDVAWVPLKVDLEFDGYLPHMSTRRQFDDDRERQNDLVDAEWKVFRLTSTSLRRHGIRALTTSSVRCASAPLRWIGQLAGCDGNGTESSSTLSSRATRQLFSAIDTTWY